MRRESLGGARGQGVWGDQKPGSKVGDTKEDCRVVGTGEQEPGTPEGCWRCRRRDGGMSRSDPSHSGKVTLASVVGVKQRSDFYTLFQQIFL